jgi:hypothetical protein
VDEGRYEEAVRGYTTAALLMVRAVRVPVLLVGLGSQVRFDELPGGGAAAAAADTGAAALRAAGARVRLAPQQRALLERVSGGGGAVLSRGAFTAGAVEAAGLPPPLPLGCPSLLLNRSPALGRQLQRGWRAALAARSPQLRLAVTLPKVHADRPFPDALVELIATRVLARFNASVVVLQTEDDLHTLQARGCGATCAP